MKLNNLSKSNLKVIMLGVFLIQVLLVIKFYTSIAAGVPAFSQLWLGLNFLVCAAFLSIYQFGLKKRKFILYQSH